MDALKFIDIANRSPDKYRVKHTDPSVSTMARQLWPRHNCRDELCGCSLMCRATPGEMVFDNTVTVEGLTGGKAYEFHVAAVNEVGQSEYARTKEAIRPPS